jgi:AcrR family transcriptional regulator
MTAEPAEPKGRRPRRVRRGRRPGSPDTRQAVLAAAREAFAEYGYDEATIRRIAARAEVDPALVHHYFGTKEQLFVEANDLPVDPGRVIPEVLAGGQDGLGERLLSTVLEIWEKPGQRKHGLALLGAAVRHERFAAVLRGFLTHAIFSKVVATLDVDRPEYRVSLVASHVIGVVMVRHVLKLEPLASTPLPEVIATVAPTIQRYLTGPLPDVPEKG